MIGGFTDDAIMSAVRSVSGLAIDVLKLDPLCTVNHCPFLCIRISPVNSRRLRPRVGVLLSDQLSFPQIGQRLLSSLKSSGGINLPKFQLRLVFNRSDLSTNRISMKFHLKR